VIVLGQGSAGTAPSLLLTVPPGPCAVTVWNSGGTAVAVGAGTLTAVSGSAGALLAPSSVPLVLTAPKGCAPTSLYSVLAAGTAPAAVSFAIVTDR
jgi:hypothetical protein